LEGAKSELLKSSNGSKTDQNGERQSSGSIELANTKDDQRYHKVLGVSQLLLAICKGFCKNSLIPKQSNQKGGEMELESGTAGSI